MESRKQIRYEYFRVAYWNDFNDRWIYLTSPSSYGAAIDFVVHYNGPELMLELKMCYMKPEDVLKFKERY